MPATVNSVNGVGIRLTEERWQHITFQHPELAGLQADVLDTVENPEQVLQGKDGQLISVKTIKPDEKWLLVVYRELDEDGVIVDGFIVTAFFNQRRRYLEGKKVVWP
jgi:hypothetical protein